jgi:hypothetical protein
MRQYIYVYDDLSNPANSSSGTAIRQLEKKTGMDERTIGRKFKKNNVYCDPDGKFKIMRLPLDRDNRRKNGNSDNFKTE